MPLPNTSTISSYNGFGKQNNVLLPPSNVQTDWDNPSLAYCTSDVAALGLTAPKCWVRLTLASTTGGLVLNNWKAQWQNATITPPVLSRTGLGVFLITFPTVVSDEYDASVGITNNITLNMTAANANLEGSTFAFINCQASGNVLTIRTAYNTGSANDLAGVTVTVFGF